MKEYKIEYLPDVDSINTYVEYFDTHKQAELVVITDKQMMQQEEPLLVLSLFLLNLPLFFLSLSLYIHVCVCEEKRQR